MRVKKRRLAIAAAVLIGVALIAAAPSVFPGPTLALSMRVERGRAGLAHRTIAAAGHTVHYTEGGPVDAPVVLLLHGFNGDKDNWTRFARFLTDRYRVIAPDLPGWGESTRTASASYDIGAQAERLEAFARAMKLERFHLAGNSMGGHLAGAYASRHPERVLTVGFFANGGVTSPRPSELRRALEMGRNPLIVDDAEGYRSLMAFIFVEVPWIPDAVVAHFTARAIAQRAFSEKIWKDLGERPFPLEPVLPSMSARALVLWGDTDRVLDPSSAGVMRRLLPRSEVVIMERCGHVPMIERPEEAARHYLAFLSR